MSLRSCIQCWDDPCTCGWNYRNWSKEALIEMRDIFQKLIDGTHMYSGADKRVDVDYSVEEEIEEK